MLAYKNVKLETSLIKSIDDNDRFAEIRNDLKSIREAGIIIANATIPFFLAGLMELVLAKYFKKLAITVLDKNSIYIKNYIVNLWLENFSDYVVFSILEAIKILKAYQTEEEIISTSYCKQKLG